MKRNVSYNMNDTLIMWASFVPENTLAKFDPLTLMFTVTDTPCLVLNPSVNFLSRLAPFISWTHVSFSTLFRHFFTPGSSLGVSGGNGHKYASHTTSLLASHTWNGLLLSFFKKSKASKSLSTLFYERKESLWNDLVSWFKPLQSALLV